jgi:hypothetical protein
MGFSHRVASIVYKNYLNLILNRDSNPRTTKF